MRGLRTVWGPGSAALLVGLLTACGHNDVLLQPSDPPEVQLLVPTDTRPPVRASSPPPPLSGGTLLFTRDGEHVIAADPERDRIVVVDVPSGSVVASVELNRRDEPGRVVEDASGRVHVVLRGSGELASFSLDSPSALQRRSVCVEPRGLAYSAERDQLLLACRDGLLLGLDPHEIALGPSIAPLAQLESDLRDVVITSQLTNGTLQERVEVTRFRSAEILELNADFRLSGKRALSTTIVERLDDAGGSSPITFDAAVAWKAASREGDMIVVHQRAQRESVDLSKLGANAYGAGECQSIVGSAVTIIKDARLSTFPVRGALPLDASLSVSGKYFAVINAGLADPGALTVSLAPQGTGPLGADPPEVSSSPIGISVHETLAMGGDGCSATMVADISSLNPDLVGEGDATNQPVAVAFSPTLDTQLVALLRDPAELWIIDDFFSQVVRRVSLGGVTVTDTGHELFHRAAGAAVACASCHPEGTEDGRTWVFSDVGERRTQSLEAGLASTAPFHWDGAFADISVLMDEVFVARMGGIFQSAARLDALEAWLFAERSPAAMLSASDSVALRGRVLFESPEIGCAQCHSGAALTNNQSVDVGTSAGRPLQVPSLLGVGYRTPLMHDGCARTLRERFEPSCGGGETHGHTERLAESELDALVAYMKSL